MPDATPTEVLLLKQAFETALQAAAPSACLPPALDAYPRKPALVLGTGKAAASMTAALCAHWNAPTRGLVVTRYGHGLKPGETSGGVEVVEAGHPSPDASSLASGARLLELAASAREDEYLFCLISGGGSSLAAAPMPPITFEQKRAAANYLIRAGADIREINCVRKHLSKLKGGRLAAAAHPSRVITFVISDIPGDDVADIASGPTIPDATTQADARAILEKYRYPNVAELMPVLGRSGAETPKPGAPEFASDEVHLIATASTALDAATKFLRGHGYEVVYLGADLDDEAQELGRRHALLAKEQRARGQRVAILSGGETRVVLGEGEGGGRGGRNTEYIASLALALDGCPGVFALAADTDGIDGHGDHAGAFIVPETLRHGATRGDSLATLLARHDTYSYFDSGRYLVKTGPTRTNVNDFRLILCQP
ncbi:MAG TPA: glycerate kinase [Gammaproteobacteria bacterium]|nr:glycerate kinase [Gammaproteobacteria bacterium]